jgi:hypothetical protein
MGQDTCKNSSLRLIQGNTRVGLLTINGLTSAPRALALAVNTSTVLSDRCCFLEKTLGKDVLRAAVTINTSLAANTFF